MSSRRSLDLVEPLSHRRSMSVGDVPIEGHHRVFFEYFRHFISMPSIQKLDKKFKYSQQIEAKMYDVFTNNDVPSDKFPLSSVWHMKVSRMRTLTCNVKGENFTMLQLRLFFSMMKFSLFQNLFSQL